MKRLACFVSLFAGLAGTATAQDIRIDSPYVCRDGTSQLRVTNCAPRGREHACDLESLKNGKWEAFIHASTPTIANALRGWAIHRFGRDH